MFDITHIREIRTCALKYFYLGFNVTGIMKFMKAPYHRWIQMQTERQTEWQAVDHEWHRLTGLGVITGINSLFCLDFDKCDPSQIPMFLELLELPDDYNWVVLSGSGKGFHIWFTSEQMQRQLVGVSQSVQVYLPKVKGQFSQLELRINAHVVMPPSKTKSGGEYRFIRPNDLTQRPIEIAYDNNASIS